MSWKRLLVAPLVVGTFSACCPRPLPTRTFASLDVAPRPQETDQWCWAASGQMIMNYLGHDVSQCRQANQRYGHSGCPCHQCDGGHIPNPPCVEGGWPRFADNHFTYEKTLWWALPWEDLQREVSDEPCCRNKPFAFTWAWVGGGGHMMVAKGYKLDGAARYVEVLDPWEPCRGGERIMLYEYFDKLPGDHLHWDDFYNIKYEDP